MAKSLLDTAAYIDFQRARNHRRQPWAVNTLRHVGHHIAERGKLCLCTPTLMEIVSGLELGSQLREFEEEVLPTFEVIVFDRDAACLAGGTFAKLELARQRIGVVDTALAAVAVTRGLTLVSSNKRHFQRIVDLGYALDFEDWRDG